MGVSGEEKDELVGIAHSRTLPHGMVQRGPIVLACAEGESHLAIAKRLGISHATAGRWGRRYHGHGIEGLQEEQRPGHPPAPMMPSVLPRCSIGHCSVGPPHATHGSGRPLAQHTGISRSIVHRWFQLFNLQPHRQQHFKLSNDPCFVDKVQDMVGLYLTTGSCPRPLRGREEANPGSGANRAHAAVGTGRWGRGYP